MIVLSRGQIPGWGCDVHAGGESLIVVCACRAQIPQPAGTWIDGRGIVQSDLRCERCGAEYPAGTLVLEGYGAYVDEMLRRWGIA